jgi:predicted dehydrogenase
MKAMSDLNVAFVGCGRISDLHAAAYSGGIGARIYAVCDADRGLAERRAAEWGASRVASFEEILEDPAVDAVELLTPQALHEGMTIRALRSGKHVSVQKPMATSLASADRMIEAARESGKILKVAENYVHYPPLELAKRLIEEGAIGDPMVMRTKMISGGSGGWAIPDSSWAWRLAERAEGRGMNTFDHGHHMYAAAWFLMGEIEKVEAWIDEVGGLVDSPAVVMWKHRGSRRYGQCEFHYGERLVVPSSYYANDEWFDVSGSAGVLCVNRCTASLREGPALSVYSGGTRKDYAVETDWATGFAGAARNFMAAIRGEEEPRPSAEEARHVLAVDLAVSRSDRIGRAVWIDELDSPFPRLYALARARGERRAKAAFGRSLARASRHGSSGSDGASGSASGERARELTLGLGSRFVPSAAAGLEADIGIVLDRGSERPSSFVLSLRPSGLRVREGEPPAAALLTLRATSATWEGILLGKARIETEYLRGKLRVDGEVAQALRLRGMLGL